MKKFIALVFILISVTLLAQTKPLTVDDLWAMKRIGSFDISPDGKSILFSVTIYSIEENKGNTDIYFVKSDGTDLHPVLNSDENESDPKFLPDGKHFSYNYKGNIWISDLAGENRKQLIDLPTGSYGAVWSNDGKKLLFTSKVYPECTSPECNTEKDKKKEKSKVKAKIITELMFRHWDSWRGEKRSHLFLYDTQTKEITDLLYKSKFDVPPIALGGGYTFSPGRDEIAFCMNESGFLATSTNNDIFTIKLSGINKKGKKPYTKISVSKGNDTSPVYSPDGKYLAFLSMEREGFESDKLRIILLDRKSGELINLSDNFDFSAQNIVWSPDSKYIYFTAANKIYNSIFKVNVETKKFSTVLETRVNTGLTLSHDGKKLFFKQQRSTQPYEIFSISANGKNLKQITSVNAALLGEIEMNEIETFWSKGANGTPVQSILVKPPFFDPQKKYPMIFLIHGGPQGHWTDDFHYRWNIQLFASKGYVVVAPNPRGSVGYGQKFTDEISRDWGGKVYTDLMNAYDYALANFEFIDKDNTFAAGASYGGYMINWIEGHTDRFNALVCHDGVFDLESMYGTTEELWFPEWEFGGPPWESRELYRKWSPHMYVKNFKTPMLVIHGANDFRVTEGQAFELFTSLQRMGVESKFLYFPDETHFVTKPQNSKLWWNTIFKWFSDHKKEK